METEEVIEEKVRSALEGDEAAARRCGAVRTDAEIKGVEEEMPGLLQEVAP